MFLSRNEASDICEKLLAQTQADACVIEIDGGEDHNLRFSRGSATTNTSATRLNLKISSHINGRVGSMTTTSLDTQTLETTQRRSEEIARLLPPDPEYILPLGPQHYENSTRYHDDAKLLQVDALVVHAQHAIAQGQLMNVETYGCVNGSRHFNALATSSGLFSFERRSEIDLSVTARTRTDSWSGWAGAHEFFAPRLNAAQIALNACKKAAASAAPKELEPGSYTVILEPEATAELAFWLMSAMDARAADEGRSFYARPGGGSLIGEKLFDEKLTIRVDPNDPLAPESSAGYEGVPHRSRAFIKNGVLTALYRSRTWAHKINAEPIPFARNFIVEGGATSLEEMIRATKRGVLITRLWYTNLLEPRALLLTGLTRDGNFLIENGRLTAPARNMRFNQSLGALFSSIEALSPTQRTWRAVGTGAPAAPALLVKDFLFSSQSSGI